MPPAASSEEDPQESALEIESPAIQFLPRGDVIPGWTMTGDPEVYPAARLENWFAEEADEHRAYRIVDGTIGRYESVDGATATIELLRFPDFVQAFGSWSSTRPPHGEILEIPNRSYRVLDSIHIWRGPFYVRVTGSAAVETGEDEPTTELASQPDTPEDQETTTEPISIEELARATVASIPQAPGLPGVMRFLPSADRIQGSERYLANDGLGHPFLANSFLADFRKGTDEDPEVVTGLILPSPSRDTARRILGALQAFYERNGRVLDQIPNLGEENFTGEDEYSGRLIALRIDRFVVVFSGFTDVETLRQMAISTDERIIAAIRQALEQAERAERERSRSRN